MTIDLAFLKELLPPLAIGLFVTWFVLHERRTRRDYARAEREESLARATAALATATADPLPSIVENESLVLSIPPVRPIDPTVVEHLREGGASEELVDFAREAVRQREEERR